MEPMEMTRAAANRLWKRSLPNWDDIKAKQDEKHHEKRIRRDGRRLAELMGVEPDPKFAKKLPTPSGGKGKQGKHGAAGQKGKRGYAPPCPPPPPPLPPPPPPIPSFPSSEPSVFRSYSSSYP